MPESAPRPVRVAVLLVPGVPFAADWALAASHATAVDVVTISVGRADPDRRLLERGIPSWHLPLLRLRPKRLLGPLVDRIMARRLARVVDRIERERGRVDVVHAHFFGSGRWPRLLHRRRPLPYVVTEHSTRLTGASAAHKPLTGAGLRTAAKVYRDAALVICVSEYLRSCVSARELTARTTVIGNPIDVELFRPRDVPREDGGRCIVSVGRLEADKDPGLLIEAFAAVVEDLPGVRLVMIGDGPMKSAVGRAVMELGLAANVELTGRLPRAEVALRLQGADAFCLASRVETFCMAAAEALACGIPVVMPRIGPLPELVDESTGVLVAPRSVAALADGIKAVLAPGKHFDGQRATAQIRGRFEPAVVGMALACAYRQIIQDMATIRR